MVTNYERGRAFEYKVRDHLKAEGYQVFRMAGSHSCVDLIAVNKDIVIGVRVA